MNNSLMFHSRLDVLNMAFPAKFSPHMIGAVMDFQHFYISLDANDMQTDSDKEHFDQHIPEEEKRDEPSTSYKPRSVTVPVTPRITPYLWYGVIRVPRTTVTATLRCGYGVLRDP